MAPFLLVSLSLMGCFRPESHEEGNPECMLCTRSNSTQYSDSDLFYIALIGKIGFNASTAKKYNEGFIVEGDIYFAKAKLQALHPLLKTNQRTFGFNVNSSKASTIRLLIDPSMSSWKNEICQAVDVWNSFGSNITLNIVSSSPDITIISDIAAGVSGSSSWDDVNSAQCGEAGVPSGGNPYPTIVINVGHPTLLSSLNARVALITHEIGHSIGFAHTNESFGSQISGTPTDDYTSIMNSGFCAIQANQPHPDAWDRISLTLLYPKDIPISSANFDGDTRDDLAVWRHSNGNWFDLTSVSGFGSSLTWQSGTAGDSPLSKTDIDGDGKADMVTWKQDGQWLVRTSSSNYNSTVSYSLGAPGDRPLYSMNIDGDSKDDLVVWRWTNGTFYILKSTTNYSTMISYQWGGVGDIPVPDTDIDGDGKDDLVVWRPSNGNWYSRISSTGYGVGPTYQWGALGDVPVSGTDYDGDNKNDLVVWRPTTGQWFILKSSTGFSASMTYGFGAMGDVPIGDMDIDRDGLDDLVVWRKNNAAWYGLTRASGFTTGPTIQWGS